MTVCAVFVNRDEIMGVTGWQASNRLQRAVYSAVLGKQLNTLWIKLFSQHLQWYSPGIPICSHY